MNEEVVVGVYRQQFNELLNLNISSMSIVRSKGLISHLIKRRHFVALKYIDYIPDIIRNPDFIGVNPNETKGMSIELVKCFKDNILMGIKMSPTKDKLYVSTMFDISTAKIRRRVHSKRLIVLDK